MPARVHAIQFGPDAPINLVPSVGFLCRRCGSAVKVAEDFSKTRSCSWDRRPPSNQGGRNLHVDRGEERFRGPGVPRAARGLRSRVSKIPRAQLHVAKTFFSSFLSFIRTRRSQRSISSASSNMKGSRQTNPGMQSKSSRRREIFPGARIPCVTWERGILSWAING